MKKTLLFLIIIFDFQLCKADCLACWTLEPVNIQLESGEKVEGFILWNKSWLRTEEETTWPFAKQVINFHRTEKHDSLQFFEEVVVLGEHLPIKGFVASSDKYFKLSLNDIEDIKSSEFEGEKLNGAGWVDIFEPRTIELLKKKPLYYSKKEGVVSETYFLSYNPKYQDFQLDSISETRDLYDKRKTYENDGLIILTISWD